MLSQSVILFIDSINFKRLR